MGCNTVHKCGLQYRPQMWAAIPSINVPQQLHIAAYIRTRVRSAFCSICVCACVRACCVRSAVGKIITGRKDTFSYSSIITVTG
jgi:hypothetical protein